jgi:hypothetical protein
VTSFKSATPLVKQTFSGRLLADHKTRKNSQAVPERDYSIMKQKPYLVRTSKNDRTTNSAKCRHLTVISGSGLYFHYEMVRVSQKR